MRTQYDPAFDAPFDTIMEEMKARSTGRWDWDKAHLVFTGKDADLEPWGQQALELRSVDEDTVHFTLHCYATIVGDDVCLNMPEDAERDDDLFSEVRDCYLDQAREVICGTGMEIQGEWTGDEWALWMDKPLTVPLLFDEVGEVDAERVVDSMVAAADPLIETWEEEMRLVHEPLDVLAGWTDIKGNRVPASTVAEGSAYWLWKEYLKEKEDA